MIGVAFTWTLLLAWMTLALCYYALALRLGYLRRTKRSLKAPSTSEFLLGSLGYRGAGFILGSEYEAIGDPLVSRLVVTVRTAFVGQIVLILIGILISQL